MSLILERNHRLGQSDECPDCGYKAPNHFHWLRDIRRVVDTGHPDKVMVYGICPMCGATSWAHYRRDTMKLLNEYPEYIDNVAPLTQHL